MKGTITACNTIPKSPVCICDQMTAGVNGVTDWNISTSTIKAHLPATCAKSTAGNANQAFFEILFANSPETAANTASSTTINGRIASAGLGFPKAKVIR